MLIRNKDETYVYKEKSKTFQTICQNHMSHTSGHTEGLINFTFSFTRCSVQGAVRVANGISNVSFIFGIVHNAQQRFLQYLLFRNAVRYISV